MSRIEKLFCWHRWKHLFEDDWNRELWSVFECEKCSKKENRI